MQEYGKQSFLGVLWKVCRERLTMRGEKEKKKNAVL